MSQSHNTPFLQLVAQDLYRRFGGDLRQVTVVFPGKRASVFMNQYLYEEAGHRALWAPRYTTISELFEELSPLSINDPIDTICRLYVHYRETTGDRDTSLDRFYGWGERLLADFDDIDKNIASMAHVRQLFCNIADIKNLESLDYLSEDQRKVLRDFFHDFSLADNSVIRQRFITLWEQMFSIYERLNAELREEGLAYEGALFRSVINEHLAERSEGVYVFVGHNALSMVEKEFLRQLQHEGRAQFYWDYDVYYNNDVNEAGHFLRENLREFPNNLSEEHFDNLRHIESIEFASAPTENAQARSVHSWLQTHRSDDPTRTAVVLASESLLLPVLHSLPDSVTDINITKGFPLGHTQAFAFVERYFGTTQETDLRALLTTLRTLVEQEARQAAQTGAQDHPDNPVSPEQPEQQDTPDLNTLMDTEAWYYTYTVIGRFLNLVESERLTDLTPTTLHKLVRMNLRQVSIPFEGEPAIGLQIMGVLETRCLDFDNVLILSANEKTLPRVSSDNSFIPYNLRRAFGLTIINNKTAVYAYYFYRLLQRARHVRCVYNSSTEGTNTGEMSRFMTQLMVESDLQIKHLTLSAAPNISSHVPSPKSKPEGYGLSVSRLSPSAINKYITCPLQFYYQYIEELREPQNPSDVIAANTFGTLFHKVAELVYRHLSRDLTFPITATAIEGLLGEHERMWQFVCQSFGEVSPAVDFNGVVAEVLLQYLQRLLRYDVGVAQQGPIVIRGLEDKHYTDIQVPLPDGTVRTISTGGYIDRLDEVTLNGQRTLRVVDYKTGGTEETLKETGDLNTLFTPSKNRPKYLLQTFLYCTALGGEHKEGEGRLPVVPALYFVNHPIEEPIIKVAKQPMTDFAPLEEEYTQQLTEVMSEILDESRSFEPHLEACQSSDGSYTCPFYLLCHG